MVKRFIISCCLVFLFTTSASAQFLGGCYEQCKAGDNSASCYSMCDCVASKIFTLPRDQQLALWIGGASPQTLPKTLSVLADFKDQCMKEQLDEAAREQQAASIDRALGGVACRSPNLTVPAGAKTFQLDIRSLKLVTQDLTPQSKARYGLQSDDGVYINSAIPDFGLVAGTIVLSVDGQRVTRPNMLTSYVEAKPEGSELIMCVLREGPSGHAAQEMNSKFKVLHEGIAGPLVEWLTAPGFWSTSCEQPGVMFKRNGENLERLHSSGQYPASLTKYSSRLDGKITVQYRPDAIAPIETVEIEKVDESTQKSTFIPTDGSRRLTKEKKRCPCEYASPTVQDYCKGHASMEQLQASVNQPKTQAEQEAFIGWLTAPAYLSSNCAAGGFSLTRNGDYFEFVRSDNSWHGSAAFNFEPDGSLKLKFSDVTKVLQRFNDTMVKSTDIINGSRSALVLQRCAKDGKPYLQN